MGSRRRTAGQTAHRDVQRVTRMRAAATPWGRLAATVGLLCLCSATAFGVQAVRWGSGVFSAYELPFSAYDLEKVYHFDITLTLEPGSYVTSLPGFEWGDPAREWRFTGMQWQPDGGDLVNRFMDGSFSGQYWREGEAASTLPTGDWTHGTGSTYGQSGDDGFVGIFVDDDGPIYDILAGDAAEFGKGLLIWDPNDPGGSNKTTYLRFHTDILIPHGIGAQNMQMGWTGYDGEARSELYQRAQNSIYMTPELPPSALLGLTTLPLGLAYIRGRRRRDG
jgi:hypothetical protein